MSCVFLTIAGGVAQAAGFALTLWEVSRTQRREFPERVPIHHRLSRWMRRKLGLANPQNLASGLTTSYAPIDAGRAAAERLAESRE